MMEVIKDHEVWRLNLELLPSWRHGKAGNDEREEGASAIHGRFMFQFRSNQRLQSGYIQNYSAERFAASISRGRLFEDHKPFHSILDTVNLVNTQNRKGNLQNIKKELQCILSNYKIQVVRKATFTKASATKVQRDWSTLGNYVG